MRIGHLLTIRGTNNGFGLLWIERLEKLSESTSVSAAKKEKRGLWNSLPPVYRQCATCHTDFWTSYQKVLPDARNKAVGKETGQTNHIERIIQFVKEFLATVRSTLSFSKKLENHIGAIWYFIHHYNACLLA